MIPKRALSITIAAGMAAILFAGPDTARAQATLKVQPHTVAVGKKVTLTASGLKPNQVIFLMITPDYQKPKLATLIGYVRSNSAGNVSQKVSIPAIKHCGAATLTAFNRQSQVPVTTRITVTGCNATKKGKVPTPPKAPGKKP